MGKKAPLLTTEHEKGGRRQEAAVALAPTGVVVGAGAGTISIAATCPLHCVCTP